MRESGERVCVGCGDTEEVARLEPCPLCGRFFCGDCAQRGMSGRRFCSAECSRAYYTGESDDDEDSGTD